MKKFDIKDVFSWANCEEAKQYIDKEGYFAHTLSQLDDRIQKFDFCTLEKICDSNTNCFCRKGDGAMCYWSMFLPVDKVKEVEEKKWRAFKSIDEFKIETGLDLLNIVHYRLNPSRSIISTGYGVITEFNTSGSDKTDYITIGDTSFNLNELFNYEYLDDNEWKPFGVLEQ